MNRMLLTGVLFVSLGGLAVAASYPAPVEAQFSAACAKSAQPQLGDGQVARSYCACALHSVERRETLAQFRAETADAAKSGAANARMRSDARACAVAALGAARKNPRRK